ncbi:zinc finger protein 250-like isoform X2 [Eleutherodactylus coqui]
MMEVTNEKILHLTLEIISLLTGEYYTIVRKTCGKYVTPSSHSCRSDRRSRTQSPNNKQKILDLTNEMIELLTGEVPIRCQDVSVHLSMEEWEYLEGHKELYRDVMMEDHRPLTSPVGFGNKNEDEELVPTVPSLNHLTYEDGEINGNVQGTAEEPNSCYMAEVVVTTMTQYPSIAIEEKPTCQKGNITDPAIRSPIDHATCGSAHLVEKPSIPNLNVYTLAPQYSSAHIKEEPFLSDGYLTDPNMFIPIDNTQQQPAVHIKEETASCDEDLMDLSGSTTTGRTQFMFSCIKKEPSDGGSFLDLNMYTPTDHTQYKSHVKEEPVSCDGGNHIDPDSYTPTDHTPHYPTNIKEEQDCADAESFTSTDRTQHLFTHIKKEPVSSRQVSLTDLGVHATIESTPQCPSTSITGKSDSYDCTTDHTQHPSTEELLLLQKHEYSSPPKSVDKDISRNKNKKPEQNYNDLTISSQKDFCTIQQTTNSLDILYNCPECPECFTSNLDLVKHQIIHTGKMPFICSVCGGYFGRKYDLITHQITHGGSSAFGCPYCDQCFATKSSLSIHEKTHVQKKPLPCPECGKIFPTKKRLTIHRQIHTNERPFKCSECGDTFKRKAHLQRHQRIHEKAKQPLMSKDGDLHGSEAEVRAHKTVHEVKTVFTCSECGVCLADRVELLKHQVKHSRTKPFESSVSKSFYNSELEFQVHHQLHTLQHPEPPIHTGDTPFICSVCGKCFRRKSGLITHQITHGGSGDFRCPYCDLCFATKSSLSIHEQTHVQKKPLPCPECGKIFPTKKRLTRHRQIHTNERPFKCSECGDTFKRKAHLQRHHQNIHEKAKQ